MIIVNLKKFIPSLKNEVERYTNLSNEEIIAIVLNNKPNVLSGSTAKKNNLRLSDFFSGVIIWLILLSRIAIILLPIIIVALLVKKLF